LHYHASLLAQRDIIDALQQRLERARTNLKIGDPREPGVLVGPLIDGSAFSATQDALARAREQAGAIAGGERESGSDA
jgi:aldehyde dehydrogenase (NAD+)